MVVTINKNRTIKEDKIIKGIITIHNKIIINLIITKVEEIIQVVEIEEKDLVNFSNKINVEMVIIVSFHMIWEEEIILAEMMGIIQ